MAVQGQQARRIEWTVAEKKHDPLHSTVRQDAAQVNAAGRWLCWDGGGTGIVTKASPETSPRSGNGFPQAVPVFLFFSEVSGDPLPVLPGLPSRPVACVVLVGSVAAGAGRTSQDGGVAPRQHSVTALALAERRPVQQTLGTPGRKGAAKRSGAASRPGNEVFALLGRTGTGQCLVAVTGTALSHCPCF